MSEALAQMIWLAAGAYAALGVVVAAIALSILARIDPVAAKGPLQFRLLIAPGLAALWPVTLGLLVRGPRP